MRTPFVPALVPLGIASPASDTRSRIDSLPITPLTYTEPTLAAFYYSLAPFRLSTPLLPGIYPCVHKDPFESNRLHTIPGEPSRIHQISIAILPYQGTSYKTGLDLTVTNIDKMIFHISEQKVCPIIRTILIGNTLDM